MKEQTEVTLSTKNNDVVDLITKSGLPPTDANIILAGFEQFFDVAAEWEEEARTIVITDENYYTPEGIAAMERAGVGRKFLKNVRLDIEKKRKAEKEISLRKGQVIDGIAKALTASASLTEIYLGKQENFAKLKAAAEVERLMEIDRWKATEARVKRELEEEAAKLAEQKRIQNENKRLRKKADELDKELERERNVAAATALKEHKAADEKARIEKEKADKILAAERIRQESIRELEAVKARKERKKALDEATAAEAKRCDKRRKAEQRIATLMQMIQAPITCPDCGHTFTLEVPE